jgi:DNA-binding transcriptional LysR family regulator
MPSQVPADPLTAVRTFVQVVETGSFTEAGRRAGLTPSAVSKQISRLEQALGVRLLERTTRSVRATDAGLELCQRTRPLFEAFAEATTAVRDRSREVRGRIRVSTTPALARTRVLPARARVAAEHAGLDFELVLTGTRLDFFESELDLAVREGTLDDSTLVARSLGTASVFLCGSPDYLRTRPRIRSVDDLEKHEFVFVPAAETMGGSLRSRTGRRLALRARFRVNDLFAVRELVEAGAGIAPLPDYVADEALAAGRLIRVLPKMPIAEFAIHAVYPSRRHLPRRVSVVLDALTGAFARA